MLTTGDFEAAFRVYIDEMERCEKAACYWALLHLVVVIPDICGALETPSGEATKAAYVDWCKRMLPPSPPEPLTPEERYEMRCIVLHQGRTLAAHGRYTYFKFILPQPLGVKLHGFQQAADQITLDVVQLATEMKKALRDWFDDLQDPAEARRAAATAPNLTKLVTVKPLPVPGMGGFMVNVTHTSTST
jgi:hypothetical protein